MSGETSVVLLEQALQWLRDGFTKTEAKEVRPYGGEFSAAEIPAASYTCPAIFLTIMGWTPGGNLRMEGRHTRMARVGAFVVIKGPSRDARMVQAMALAERVSVRMRQWQPDCAALGVSIAPLEQDARCENLYSRALDKHGQALWLVDWEQAIKPLPTPPASVDLLAVEVDSNAHGTAPAPATTTPNPLTVTHDITLTP